MLKDTTNRLYSVYKRMPAAVQDKWDSVYAQRIAEYRKGDLKGKALISWKYQQYMRDYLATVLSVDENICLLYTSGIYFETIEKTHTALNEWWDNSDIDKAKNPIPNYVVYDLSLIHI